MTAKIIKFPRHRIPIRDLDVRCVIVVLPVVRIERPQPAKPGRRQTRRQR